MRVALPVENHSGVELAIRQRASLHALEDKRKLCGWIVILSADPNGDVRVTDTTGAQFLISRDGEVTTLAA